MFGHKIKSKNTYHDDDDESKHTVTHMKEKSIDTIF